MGDIRDEYDEDEEEELVDLGDGQYLAEGSMKLDDLNDILDLELSSEDYDSVGGLVIDRLEHLPSQGEEVMCGNVRLVVEQVEKQLNKLIEVIKVRTLEENALIGRELMLLKVNANNKTRQDIMTICEIMGAKVTDISPTSLTLELSDTPDRLDTFQSMMRPFSILEVARTGVIAVQKGGGKI